LEGTMAWTIVSCRKAAWRKEAIQVGLAIRDD
jgi:hypothetical protein